MDVWGWVVVGRSVRVMSGMEGCRLEVLKAPTFGGGGEVWKEGFFTSVKWLPGRAARTLNLFPLRDL